MIVGKFNFEGFLGEQGVNVDHIGVGRNANMMSFATGFSKAQERKINSMMDQIYRSVTRHWNQPASQSDSPIPSITY